MRGTLDVLAVQFVLVFLVPKLAVAAHEPSAAGLRLRTPATNLAAAQPALREVDLSLLVQVNEGPLVD